MGKFDKFAQSSGLQANKDKSSIYFGGMSSSKQMRILQETRMTLGQLPFKYLGIPLSSKKLTLNQWLPLVEKIVARITTWAAKTLSYAGRLQLIQAVVFEI